MNKTEHSDDLNRRDFLRGGSFATLMMLLGGVPIRAAEDASAGGQPARAKSQPQPVKLGLIGCGQWGRDILEALAGIPHGPVVAICETFPAWLNRAGRLVPDAKKHTDYRQLLAQEDVEAVIVATPTHLHRQIVLDAFEAGKHVYCEVPLAHTVEDARAIATAARDHLKLNFQAGLQQRSDPQLHHLLTFIRTGVLGREVKVRSQWHKKQSWRRASATPERERELNWRLDKSLSTGLIGELGIHQLDLAAWFLRDQPLAVTGFGATIRWDDGRQVPDTVQAILEFPRGTTANFEGSLATSFDGSYDLFYGSDSTIMLRERRAWMFKEADAPLLGWEVYARKEVFYKESGIVLGANATKLAAQGEKPTQDTFIDPETQLQHALKAFLSNCHLTKTSVEDFAAVYDANDTNALREYLHELAGSRAPAAGYQEGFEATVAALKANEAILKGQRVPLRKEMFALA
jgi:predicted dehydrogenase